MTEELEQLLKNLHLKKILETLDEETRRADPVYMTAIEASDEDQATWLSRAPLIEGHRVTRARR